MADGTKIHFTPENGKATVNGAEGTYNYAGTEGTVTAGGKTYKFNLNDKGQMFFTENKTKTFLWKKGATSVTVLDESYETGYGMNDGAGNQHQIIGYPNALSNSDSRTAMYSNTGYGIFSFGMMYGDKNVGFIGPANQNDPMVDKYIIKEVFE